MGKIVELTEDVFHKIAAGEVVERPLSVVKELVENAIDAGADEIDVELVEGGKRLIRIGDNGEGFADDDIHLAFQRHSTSKLQELSDLNRLLTLGFRGEALASILEVSRIEIKTADNEEGIGTYCVLENGRIIEKEKISFNRGTSIEVRDLFYNFPVRRKFLKSERTELNQIVSFLESIALPHYHITFTLHHQSRSIFRYQKADNLQDRVYQIFGKDLLDSLQPLDYEWDHHRCRGFVSKLNTGVSAKKHQFFFVNDRPVREKTLFAALNNTFRSYLEKHQHPVGILLLEVPPAEIDVNIHPMKLEIKFRDSGRIYRLIKNAIESSFLPEGHFEVKVDFGGRRDTGSRSTIQPSQGQLFPQSFHLQADADESFVLLGQFQDSYIVMEREKELMIIDQHNAHERINFDRLKEAYRQNKVASISPLFPVIIELSTSEATALDDTRLDILEKLGFEIRPLSGNAFDVKKIPQILGEKDIKDTILEVIHLEDGDIALEDSALSTVACKSAIKVNHKLMAEEMKQIVRDLFLSTNPYFCPHQRPIIARFPLEDIEKLMKRK
jgi:DNA mismatch repair protein MutL